MKNRTQVLMPPNFGNYMILTTLGPKYIRIQT